MYQRKTLEVDLIKQKLNRAIEHWPTTEGRRALTTALSDLLMEANQYRGFRYSVPGTIAKRRWGYWAVHTDGTQYWIPGDEEDYRWQYY